ncbi:MAG: lysylphosphatidylglycerol synthase transmembrane domain-containing protein [Alphaproteobacteria bacterium]
MQPVPQKQRKSSTFLSLLFKVALTAAAFWFALHDVTFEDLAHTIQQQKIEGLLLAGLCIFCQIVLGGLRWRYILSSLSEFGKAVISTWDAVRLYYISVFFSSCLPGTVGGDVVRVWITKSERISLSLSVNSIILDRLIALAALAVIVCAMLPMLADVMGFNFWLAYIIIMISLLLGLWFLRGIEKFFAPYKHIKLVHFGLYFIGCLRQMVRSSGTGFNALVFAVAAHIFSCACTYIIAQGMGVPLSFQHALMFVPLVMLITTLPISIGGWGVREVSMVWFLGLVGISSGDAVAISLQTGLMSMLMSMPGALLWLLHKRKSGTMPA